MRIAYVDDSGSGGDSPYYVLAGYSAEMEEWVRFTESWQSVLDSNPKISYFKMSEAGGCRGEFGRFSNCQRDRKVNDLISVVQHHRLFETSVLIPTSNFNSIALSSFPEEVRNPYALGFACMVGLTPFLDQVMGVPSEIDFVFDSDERNEFTGRRFFKSLMRKIPQISGQLGEIRYEDDQDCLPLQAADLIAWQNRRFFSFPQEPLREELKRRHIRRDLWFRKILSRDDIAEMLPLIDIAFGFIKGKYDRQTSPGTDRTAGKVRVLPAQEYS